LKLSDGVLLLEKHKSKKEEIKNCLRGLASNVIAISESGEGLQLHPALPILRASFLAPYSGDRQLLAEELPLADREDPLLVRSEALQIELFEQLTLAEEVVEVESDEQVGR